MIVSGLATALNQGTGSVSLTGMSFTRRRLQSGEHTVTISIDANPNSINALKKGQDAREENIRRRLASLESVRDRGYFSNSLASRSRIELQIRKETWRLEQMVADHHGRRLQSGNQDISTNYQVSVTDQVVANSILSRIEQGNAAAFEAALQSAIEALIAADPDLAAAYSLVGVTSLGGTIQQAVTGGGAGGGSAGLKSTPKIKDAAIGGKSLLGITAFTALFLLHVILHI
jgi:hypothetical protein